MATNFPTSVDALTNPVSNDSLNSPSHSAQHANANDAIEAVEGYLLNRVYGSGIYTANAVLTVGFLTYITINLTNTGRPVLLNVGIVYTNANSGANREVSYQVLMDATTILAPGSHSSPLLSAGSVFGAANSVIVTPASGARAFTLQVQANNASSCRLQYATMTVVEL
jgi:hypothetical protein